MRGSPAFLGGVSALFGLLTSLMLLRLYGGCHDVPCPEVPLSYSILIQLIFACPILGLVGAGAWELGRYRKASSLTLLVAGLLPIVPGLLALVQAPSFINLNGFLVVLWWSPLLVLAGVLGILKLPGPHVRHGPHVRQDGAAGTP